MSEDNKTNTNDMAAKTSEPESDPEKGDPIIGQTGKRFSELSGDELVDAVSRGDVVLPRFEHPGPKELFDFDRLEKFIMGEITWAQLQGLTLDDAYRIAEYGYALFQEARYHDAKVIFEGLVVANPYDAYFHSMAGSVYQQLDMRLEAIDSYTIAIEMDPEYLPALVNRGEMYLQDGIVTMASPDLTRVLELDPECESEPAQRAVGLLRVLTEAVDEYTAEVNAQKNSD